MAELLTFFCLYSLALFLSAPPRIGKGQTSASSDFVIAAAALYNTTAFFEPEKRRCMNHDDRREINCSDIFLVFNIRSFYLHLKYIFLIVYIYIVWVILFIL